MKTFTHLAGAGLLLIGGAAYAQDTYGPADPGTSNPDDAMAQDENVPADPATSNPDVMADDAMADEMIAEPTSPDDIDKADGVMERDTMADEMPTADPMEPAGTTADTMTTTDPAMSAAPGMAADAATYTDAQIDSFAAAALQIQGLQGDAATVQQQAGAIVGESGLDPTTFNAISTAMETDPALAQRVQAAAAARAQPEG